MTTRAEQQRRPAGKDAKPRNSQQPTKQALQAQMPNRPSPTLIAPYLPPAQQSLASHSEKKKKQKSSIHTRSPEPKSKPQTKLNPSRQIKRVAAHVR